MQKRVGAAVSLLFLSSLCLIMTLTATATEKIEIPVGVILDLNSSLGSMALNSITMGLQDFYSHHPHYTTKLHLHSRHSQHDVHTTAASAALDLIKNEKVIAIMGPQNSEQARLVAELGTKAQVPIISFSATSPSLYPTQSDCSQFKAIAAIVEVYGWHEIIPIYEDTKDGNALFPCLRNALQEMDARMPYTSSIDPHFGEAELLKEINKLKGMQTHVFLVHLNVDIGPKFFKLAHKAGMMSEGYAWIVTQGLSGTIDPSLPKLGRGYMQGVLGVRPMVPKTKELVDLKRRWKVEFNNTILTLFGLWAYDTVQMLANAVEKVGIVNFTLVKPNTTCVNTVDLVNEGISETGSRLLNTILTTKFKGISGDLNLNIDGRHEPSVFEVFNVNRRKEMVIGYWSPERRLFRNLVEFGKPIATGEKKLKQPIWPGYTIMKPPKLRIGVPVRKGLAESFVKVRRALADQSLVEVERGYVNSTAEVSGFAIDLFSEVVNVLPFGISYEFVPLVTENEVATAVTDDVLLCQIKEKKLDAVVGAITILVNRTRCVDFTLPYMESSVSMVVLMGSKGGAKNLLRPFDTELWKILGTIFGVGTYAIIMFEFFKNRESKRNNKYKEVIEFLSFPVSVYNRESKDWMSIWSKWLALVMSFLFVMVVQIYTASLTSMLTEGTLMEPLFKDIEELKRNNYSVGYQNQSFVKGLLIDLGLKESQLKPYGTLLDCIIALSRGIERGGVAAIFDETPYIMLLLSRYGPDRFTMVGPRYHTDGFGFAFPRGSGLMSNFSVAILNVTQDRQKLEGIKNKYFLSSPVPSEFQSASHTRSLTIGDFWSLLKIVLYILSVFGAIGVLRYVIGPFISWKSISRSLQIEKFSPCLGIQASPAPNEYESQIASSNSIPDDLQHKGEPLIPY